VRVFFTEQHVHIAFTKLKSCATRFMQGICTPCKKYRKLCGSKIIPSIESKNLRERDCYELENLMTTSKYLKHHSHEPIRDHARNVLLQCSRLSTQLFEQGVALRTRLLEETNKLHTYDALLTYRQAATTAFALRHSSLTEGCRTLSRNDNPGSLSSFKVIEGLGKGSFGAVFLVEHDFGNEGGDNSKQVLAIKMVARDIVANSEKRVRHLEIERRVMCQVRDHPFIVTLHYALQSPSALYFVMDYCAGGDLFYHLCQLRHKPHAISGEKHFREVEVQVVMHTIK
jgi:hypothetical protein